MQDSTKSIQTLLNPKSILIVGASEKPGSSARNIIANLLRNGYEGKIYLIGRNEGAINDIPIVISYDKLPNDIDLGILAIPAGHVYDAILDLKKINVKTIACLSSGFAELGDEGTKLQEKIGNYAFENNIRLIGPNCIGYFNYVDNFHLGIVDMPKQASFDKNEQGIAIVTQSGGIGMFIGQSFGHRGVPTSYSLTIGNQADIKLSDFVEYLLNDDFTSVIAIYAEEIKKPKKLLEVAKKAALKNKNIVMLHSGKSEASRNITQSHTGSLSSDYNLLKTKLENSGVAMVNSLEELINLSELLLRFPNPKGGEVGLMTHSGAICAIGSDLFEDSNLIMPELGKQTEELLKQNIPAYLPARNPLDVGIEASKNPSLVGIGLNCLASEPKIGSILCVLPIDQSLDIKLKYLEGFIDSVRNNPQVPAIYVALDDSYVFEDEFIALAKKQNVVIGKTFESAVKTLENLKKLNHNKNKQKREIKNAKISDLDKLNKGNVPEYICKDIIKKFDIPTPKGKLATNLDEAIKIANEISYPVVLKAQSAALAHKTDMGGVILNIKNNDELKNAYEKLTSNFAQKLSLDGVLIEQMAQMGQELVIGARRDKNWGVVILAGIGGIWIEVLKDFCLITPDLNEEAIINELSTLKSAALLKGARGSKGVDMKAVAKVVIKIGDLIVSNERISEIEINPLIAKEDSVMALDALIVLN